MADGLSLPGLFFSYFSLPRILIVLRCSFNEVISRKAVRSFVHSFIHSFVSWLHRHTRSLTHIVIRSIELHTGLCDRLTDLPFVRVTVHSIIY